MTANTEGDAFGRLPEELRIMIIKLSPDPWSLRSLAHASPAMGRVLDNYPLEILEVVLDATVPVETRHLMGAVLKARFSRFPASLSEAQKVAKINHSLAATDEMRSSRLVKRAATAVRSLLATAENVHAWSHACLEHMIRKSLELRPATLTENGSGRTSQEMFENAKSHKDYLPQYTGPPSWVEEQRTIKAFWRLQFFLELQSASNKGCLGWPGKEVDILSKSSLDGFYDVFDFEREQILTAYDFLSAVTSGTITLVEAVHDNACRLPAIRWIEEPMPRCPCVGPPSFGLNEDLFGQGAENLDRMPNSYAFYYVMSNSGNQWLDGWPPLLGFSFQLWRKYGFAIWDNKRMNDLGMRDPRPKRAFENYSRYSFRWFSILTKEDLA